MKKFLTVLLVIAVMFTFSFSSAFALPSDTTEYAGVADAQKDALAEIENYAKVSDYTAEGQAQVLTLKTAAEKDVKDATSIGEVLAIVEDYKDDIDALKGYLRATASVVDAAKRAEAQAADYRLDGNSLYGLLFAAGYIYEDTDATGYAVDLAELKAALADFERVIANGKAGIGTVEGIEVAFDKLVSAANAFGKKYFAESDTALPQEAIDDLVEWIIEEADRHEVSTDTHSAAIMAKYEAAIKAGKAAAKAVKTWDEYEDVYEEYVGMKYPSYANTVEGDLQYAAGNEVIVCRKTTSVFAKLAAMTKDKEAMAAAAKQVLDKIGAYDYKKVAIYGWEAAEDAIDALEAIIEEGADPSEDVSECLEGIKASSTKAEVKAAVEAAVAEYESLLFLPAIKAYAASLLDSLANVNPDDYPAKNDVEIANIAKQAKVAVKAAKDIETIVEIVLNAYNDIDAVPTQEDVDKEEAVKAYNKSVDKALEEIIAAAELADEKFALSADENLAVERLVQALKDKYADEGYDNGAKNEITEDEYNTLEALVNDAAYSANNAESLFPLVIADEDDYRPIDQKYIEIAGLEFEAAAGKAKTWAAYFNALDAAEKTLAGFVKGAVKDFEEALTAAEEAVAALGTPALTAKFEAALDKAEDKLGDLIDAAVALDDFDYVVAKQARIVKLVKVFYEKVHEYCYLEYLDDIAAGTESTPTVEEFYDIAEDFTGYLMGCYDDAAQGEISKIITDAYKAIREAKTADDMEKIAENAIKALDAVKEKPADTDAYNEVLANVKAEAAKYFNKYYGVTFTSEATTHLQLAYDVMDFQEELATVEARNEAKITAVESLKITASSKATKGAITVTWKVVGDKAAADGYQIWKSTKKNSGFKKAFTTTKTSYKNTKGLKKGTRYYYKVRAYVVVEGKTYYSDWSNKAYRVAK